MRTTAHLLLASPVVAGDSCSQSHFTEGHDEGGDPEEGEDVVQMGIVDVGAERAVSEGAGFVVEGGVATEVLDAALERRSRLEVVVEH